MSKYPASTQYSLPFEILQLKDASEPAPGHRGGEGAVNRTTRQQEQKYSQVYPNLPPAPDILNATNSQYSAFYHGIYIMQNHLLEKLFHAK